MSAASDVLALAASQIGYSRYSDPETGTKYGRYWAQKLNMPWLGANGVSFCDMGVNWTFAQLGMGFFEGQGIYYVPATVEQARAKDWLVDPRSCAPGDPLVFDWDGVRDGDHIGFCEVNRGGYVQTIEYNTGDGQVLRRTRDWSVVSYAIRLPYEEDIVNDADKNDIAQRAADKVVNYVLNGTLLRDRIIGTDQAANECRYQLTRTDDPTGRGMTNDLYTHVKYIAQAVTETKQDVAALKADVEGLKASD